MGGLDWFGGMATPNVQGLRAAAAGRIAKEAYKSSGAVSDMEFTDDETGR